MLMAAGEPSYLDIARLLLWARSPRSGHERFLGERVERIKPLASANAGKRLVDGAAGQPRREPRPPLEIVQVLVRTRVGILHHVLGLVVIVEDGARRAIDMPLVAAPEDLEQALFAGANARAPFLQRP